MGSSRGSDPVFLRLGCGVRGLSVTAPVGPLAWELQFAAGAPLEKKKKKVQILWPTAPVSNNGGKKTKTKTKNLEQVFQDVCTRMLGEPEFTRQWVPFRFTDYGRFLA